MQLPGQKKISALFSVLAGKRGPKPQIWTGMAIVAEVAAIGVGTAVAVSAWPLSAAFFAASLAVTGVSSAANAAGSVSNHKHFSQITELAQKNLTLEQENLKIEKRLLELLEAQQEEAKAPDPDTNPVIQNSPKQKKLPALFSVLKGKRGSKPQIWTGLTIATEAAAIGVGITVAVGAWPLTAAFFAASLATTGISSAVNAASAVSNHKHFETITDLQEKNVTLQQKNLEIEKKLVALLETRQTKSEAAPAPGPV